MTFPDGATATTTIPVIDSYTCALARALLHEHIDGELVASTDAQRLREASLVAHLDDCTSCARLERQLRAMRTALRGVGARLSQRETASPTLRARIAALMYPSVND